MQAVSLVLKRAREVSIANKFILAFGMAGLTGILAQLRIMLPWTPVPITGQTLAVLLAGVLLGRSWGGISQVIYVVLGVAGIPWFNGFAGGYGVLLTPSGGYLLGFILS
ncbi:MAG: biotin transporter BioY, partial [Candidatus Omnitrophota bacterium]